MNDQLTSIMKQRGKVVGAFALMAWVLCLVHPEQTATVWGPTALAVGALAAMEAVAAIKGAAE